MCLNSKQLDLLTGPRTHQLKVYEIDNWVVESEKILIIIKKEKYTHTLYDDDAKNLLILLILHFLLLNEMVTRRQLTRT